VGVPVARIVGMIQQQVGRPVYDKTEVKGLFDFKLQFSREGLAAPSLPAGLALPSPPPPPPPGAAPIGAEPAGAADPLPSLFTALQQLGLRLESVKGPAEVLVIDSVQKPTEN